MSVLFIVLQLLLQPASAESATPAPLGEVGISWPSLGDAKQPLKKKDRADTGNVVSVDQGHHALYMHGAGTSDCC